jgi:hypothetical protein
MVRSTAKNHIGAVQTLFSLTEGADTKTRNFPGFAAQIGASLSRRGTPPARLTVFE